MHFKVVHFRTDQARIQRGVTGVEPPTEKFAQKFLGLHFCWNVKHVQLKNVVVTVYIRSAGASVLSSLMIMTVDLFDAILASFSVEMILIA